MSVTKYHDRYRIPSIRLPNWDYRTPGYYFVTICTNNRDQLYFGNIRDQLMCISNAGKIAHQYWQMIPQYFQNVSLDEFVIMPDHVHGIIIIRNPDTNRGRDAINRVSTWHHTNPGGVTHKNNPMLMHQSLSAMIRLYKGKTTHSIRRQTDEPGFQWQPRYYERIIRSKQELQNVRRYIQDNPKNWSES